MDISLDEQVKCVRREIALRRNVYPRQIAKHKLSRENADKELSTMQAVLTTLTVDYPRALALIASLQGGT